MVDDGDDGFDVEPSPPSRRSARREERSRRSWSQLLLTAAVGLPAAALGGVPPFAILLFIVVVLVLWQRLCTRSRSPLVVPRAAVLGLAAAAITLVQWLPIDGMRALFAPDLHDAVQQALAGTEVQARGGLSVSPGDTGLEAARLFALSLLFIAAAQLSWRVAAAATALTGAGVALIGFAHEALGFEAIYGVYAARDIDLSSLPSMMGTFVNPNHQSGLLLLGTFCAGALAADQHRLGINTRDPSKVDRYGDRFLAAMAALTVQIPALVLSLSRAALVALLVVGPVALWLGLRQQRSERQSQRRRSRHMSPLRVVVVVAIVGLLLLVAQHGAWQELTTLLDLASPGVGSTAAPHTKFRIAAEAMTLADFSHGLGIGRGTFIDVFGPHDSQPTHVLHTHLESGPVTLLVEWGPVFGTAMLLSIVAWWVHAVVVHRHRNDGAARLMVLLGLLAVGLQNLGDFAFEFLGVAAPAVALAGSLSPMPTWRWDPRRARLFGSAALLGALVLGALSAGDTFTQRHAVNSAILAGTVDPATVAATRPLDGRLHGLWARRAFEQGDYATARERAQVAVNRQPGNVDAWLVLGAAQAQLGEPRSVVDESTRRGLAGLHAALPEPFVEYLLARYPDPDDLARLCPEDPAAWQWMIEALIETSPAHADALAAARSRQVPDDPTPLHVRWRLAMHDRNAALALHHGRMLRAAAPSDPQAHIAVAKALRLFDPPRLSEAQAVLEAAIDDAPLPDSRARGQVEEHLLGILADLGDPASLAQARELVPTLLARPADRETRRRRELLARRLADDDR